MYLNLFQTSFILIIVCTLAFEDILHVYGQSSEEIIEQGKQQYQLLKERGKLPKYGNCWKAAVEHLDEGCRYLSEETQSDVALHLTNCFLDMSGHNTYNCEHDKKPNLRGICINSMTDRAFNVYTEFYTHVQNMCWFLRGQIWHETIAENTLKVGEQLKVSAVNLESILQSQRESLQLQEKLLNYGKSLEKIMHDFQESTQFHQHLLMVVSENLNKLQSWLLGEVSWLDTIVFNVTFLFVVIIFTTTPRTIGARLPMLITFATNTFMERLICSKLIANILYLDINSIQANINSYVWWCRYTFVFVAFLILLCQIYFYRDVQTENNKLLKKVYEKSDMIYQILTRNNRNANRNNYSVLNETSPNLSHLNQNVIDEFYKPVQTISSSSDFVLTHYDRTPKHSRCSSVSSNGERYNLRSRQGTPSIPV